MSSSLTHALARRLLLPILVVAIAILVKGYTAVGDGFSAGRIKDPPAIGNQRAHTHTLRPGSSALGLDRAQRPCR